jgi:hypothetical protein
MLFHILWYISHLSFVQINHRTSPTLECRFEIRIVRIARIGRIEHKF